MEYSLGIQYLKGILDRIEKMERKKIKESKKKIFPELEMKSL